MKILLSSSISYACCCTPSVSELRRGQGNTGSVSATLVTRCCCSSLSSPRAVHTLIRSWTASAELKEPKNLWCIFNLSHRTFIHSLTLARNVGSLLLWYLSQQSFSSTSVALIQVPSNARRAFSRRSCSWCATCSSQCFCSCLWIWLGIASSGSSGKSSAISLLTPLSVRKDRLALCSSCLRRFSSSFSLTRVCKMLAICLCRREPVEDSPSALLKLRMHWSSSESTVLSVPASAVLPVVSPMSFKRLVHRSGLFNLVTGDLRLRNI